MAGGRVGLAWAVSNVIVGGEVIPPGDKSVTHRALILAGLSRSRVTLHHALTAADARATASALRHLGALVSPLGRGRRVHVTGGAWRSPAKPLHCGNAGTTARLLMGAIAGQPIEARITGDASLRRRPMRRVSIPLRAMGASVEEDAGEGLPLTIRGAKLRDYRYHTPVASAQIKAALLLAGVSGGVAVSVSEPVRSRDHSERLLAYLGFDVRTHGTTVDLRGAPPTWPQLTEVDLEIPGDLSSAAFLLGAATLARRGELVVRRVGVNPTRTGFLDVLARMGGNVSRANERTVCGEPVADLVVRPADLAAVTVEPDEIPSLIDEIPMLAVLAARAAGVSQFRSVGELRVKESDRLGLIAHNLQAIGVEADVQGDDLVVEGTDRPARGRIETAGDHRLAMAFSVLGLTDRAKLELSETRSASVSYPGFLADLAHIATHV